MKLNLMKVQKPGNYFLKRYLNEQRMVININQEVSSTIKIIYISFSCQYVQGFVLSGQNLFGLASVQKWSKWTKVSKMDKSVQNEKNVKN